MKSEVIFCFAFSSFSGIGPFLFSKLVEYFKLPSLAYSANKKELATVLNGSLLERFLGFRKHFQIEAEWEKLKNQDIGYVAVVEKDYPYLLKQISDPPIGLFCRGNSSLLNSKRSSFAIVGTRKPTTYGRLQAEKVARELAERGMIVVSGMALGIDTIAHLSTIKAAGQTIAVFGCGVDVVYPKENKFLYQQIIDNKGLIISEFPPKTFVQKGLFVCRNRIISGLSKGILVIEGNKHSGSLITAKYAANQGREIFALPGQLGSEMAEAPLILLKEGAHLFTSTEGLLSELGLKTSFVPNTSNLKLDWLNPVQAKILNELNTESLTVEELTNITKIKLANLLAELSFLELQGVVEKNERGRWLSSVLFN